MMEKTRFGALLKRYRQAAGLSQERLAERAGLSARAISDLERGVNQTPRYSTLELLVRALSLSPQQGDLMKAAAHPEITFLPEREVHSTATGIPMSPTNLIGREAERNQVVELLRNGRTRLLTLTGPSGVGKTRLALEIVRDLVPDFADGIIYVALESIRDAALVPSMLAQTLRLHESVSASPQELIIASLQARQLLLLLDNLEQVLDCSPFIARLLENCPQLVILATSRTPLRLRAEQEFLLAPLPLNDAVVLFTERSQSVQPSWSLPVQEVAPICQQLDCLPLAIELAAMQGRLFSLSELQRRLSQSFTLLRAGARDLPARQQTMEDAIAWSYELLSDSQQRCFRALGVFVGGWTLEAAEAVCWPQDEKANKGVAEIARELDPEGRLLSLAALVEASLVQTQVDAGVVRFSMLSLIREYALEQLNATGEDDFFRRNHAAYYASLADKAKSLFDSGPAEPHLSLVRELPNVQAALEWAEANRNVELGLQLCSFARLWHHLGQPGQAEHWFVHMLALDLHLREAGISAVPLEQRIEKLYGLGRVLLGRGQTERASSVSMEALSLAQEIGDEKGLANVWANLGFLAQASGRLEEAERAFNQSALHAGRAQDEQLRYRAFVSLADLDRQAGELNQAAALLEKALASAQICQAGWDIAIITTLLAHLARQQLDFPSAKARYAESLRHLSTFGSPTYIAWCLEGCAEVLCEEKRVVPAVHLIAAAAHMRQQASTPLPNNEREALEQVIERARGFLGQGVFLQEWIFGNALTQDEAIKLALLEMG